MPYESETATDVRLMAASDALVEQARRITLQLDVSFDEAREIINLLEKLRQLEGAPK